MKRVLVWVFKVSRKGNERERSLNRGFSREGGLGQGAGVAGLGWWKHDLEICGFLKKGMHWKGGYRKGNRSNEERGCSFC